MLAWNVDDFMRAVRSQYEPGTPAKFIDIPKARYAFFQVDKILHAGKSADMSTDVGYISNEHAFVSLWEGGAISELVIPDGANTSSAHAINDRGQIVGEAGRSGSSEGTHAYLWDEGVVTDLGELPGGMDYSSAAAINNRSQIAGTSQSGINNNDRAVMWDDGNLIDLGVPPDSQQTFGVAINIRSDVVGTGDVVGADDNIALLFTEGQIIDLSTRIHPDDPLAPYAVLASAQAINSRGQIIISGYDRRTSVRHLYLLTPTGNPR